ncbi:MAG: hypothetical protein ABSF95_15700 [Verrucomicrobiota bacterium]
MARVLRIQRPGGRYHVTARGNERKAIYHRGKAGAAQHLTSAASSMTNCGGA